MLYIENSVKLNPINVNNFLDIIYKYPYKTMPMISIIIPLYNVEKYVARCVESVLKQSYNNLEIILVNDGSTDDTRKIIDKYKSDERIVYIDTHKIGQSSARNLGIDNASGDYICFLDGDDYINADTIKKLITNIKESNADYCCCNFKYLKNNIHNFRYGKPFGINEINGEKILEEAIIGRYIKTVVWGKLYKTNLIKQNNIRFKDLRVHEDIAFTIEVAMHARKVTFVDEPLYIINQRTGSLSRNCNPEKLSYVAKAFDYVNNLLANRPDYDRLKPLIESSYLRHQLYSIIQCAFILPTFKEYKNLISKAVPSQYYSLNYKLLCPPFARYLVVLRKLSKFDSVFYYLMKILKNLGAFIS